jgi:hypothetical protein
MYSLAFLVIKSKAGQHSYDSIIHPPQMSCLETHKYLLVSSDYKNNFSEECILFANPMRYWQI